MRWDELKWEQLKESLFNFEGVYIVPKNNYVTLMLGNKTVSFFIFRKESIQIEIGRGNLKINGSKSRNFFDIDDPKNISSDYTWTWKNGTKGSRYKIRFCIKSDVEYITFLIRQKYKNLSSWLYLE